MISNYSVRTDRPEDWLTDRPTDQQTDWPMKQKPITEIAWTVGCMDGTHFRVWRSDGWAGWMKQGFLDFIIPPWGPWICLGLQQTEMSLALWLFSLDWNVYLDNCAWLVNFCLAVSLIFVVVFPGNWCYSWFWTWAWVLIRSQSRYVLSMFVFGCFISLLFDLFQLDLHTNEFGTPNSPVMSAIRGCSFTRLLFIVFPTLFKFFQ